MEKPASRPKKYLASIRPHETRSVEHAILVVYSSTRAGAIKTASSYFGVSVEMVEISPVYFPIRACGQALVSTERDD